MAKKYSFEELDCLCKCLALHWCTAYGSNLNGVIKVYSFLRSSVFSSDLLCRF
jgi:hypothetical protein